MSFEVGRWRAREWFVLGCAVLLLLVSLSDWYAISVRDAANPASAWQELASANAWQASTAWTLAVGVTAFAVALWLVHRGQAAQPAWARRTAAGLVLAALGAVGGQYLAMGDVHLTTATTQTSLAVASLDYAVPSTSAYASQLTVALPRDPIDRDHLVAGSTEGYRAGTRWGMTAGAALLAVILLALVTTTTAPADGARPQTVPPDSGDGPTATP